MGNFRVEGVSWRRKTNQVPPGDNVSVFCIGFDVYRARARDSLDKRDIPIVEAREAPDRFTCISLKGDSWKVRDYMVEEG
jgi:hypothetical protein